MCVKRSSIYIFIKFKKIELVLEMFLDIELKLRKEDENRGGNKNIKTTVLPPKTLHTLYSPFSFSYTLLT